MIAEDFKKITNLLNKLHSKGYMCSYEIRNEVKGKVFYFDSEEKKEKSKDIIEESMIIKIRRAK